MTAIDKLHIGPSSQTFEYLLRNPEPDAEGFAFDAGNPEFWHHSDLLLVPGGALLDIGLGNGRSSMYFALNGMQVLGIDTDESQIEDFTEMLAEIAPTLELPINVICADALIVPFPEKAFDTVLLDYMPHIPSKEATLELIRKAYGALKPGGHMWIRMLGKHDSGYEEALRHDLIYPGGVIDEDTIIHMCSCSGEMKEESTVFLDPLDAHAQIAQLGGLIAHSQTIAMENGANIMFGEDFGREMDGRIGGMITVIAQKPENVTP